MTLNKLASMLVEFKNDVDTKFVELNTKINNIDNKVNYGFQELNNRMDNIENRLSNIENCPTIKKELLLIK